MESYPWARVLGAEGRDFESVICSQTLRRNDEGIRDYCAVDWGMQSTQRLTAIIEREGDGFVALCPELHIASQGASIEEARANLIEALTLFFETADPSETTRRYHGELLVTQVEVPVG